MANWKTEIEFKINGKPCGENCKVKQSGYLQSVLIDARKALGGKCRRQDVLVEMAIKPASDGSVTCSLNNDNNCAPSGDWVEYTPELCEGDGAACKSRTGARTASEIHTFISQAISF
jgi:hypothetical protein